MHIEIRPVRIEDIGFLWTVLFYASHSDHEGRTVENIKSEPTLLRYLEDWGRRGDMGVVASDDSAECGAARLRLIGADHASEPTYVDAATPELAVAVLPAHQGLGVGTAMLHDSSKKLGACIPPSFSACEQGVPRSGSITVLGSAMRASSPIGWGPNLSR